MKKFFGVAFGLAAFLFVTLWVLRDRRAQGDRLAATPPADPIPAATLTTATLTTAANPPARAPAPASIDSDDVACAKMAALCSTSEEKVDTAACVRKLADGRKLSGEGNVQRSITCLEDAKTCAAATGCLAGGLGMGAVGEFLKGLGSSMSK